MLFVLSSHQFGVGHTESGEDVVCSRFSPVRGGSHRVWRGCCLFSVLTSSGWVTQSLERMLFVLGSHQFGVGHTESGEDVVCSRFSPVRGGSHRVWRGCCLFSVLTSSGWVTQSLERMLFVLGSHQFRVGHTESGEDVVCSRFSPVQGGSHRVWRGCCLFSALTSSGWVTQSLERMLFVLGSHQFRVGHTESGEDVVCSRLSPVRGGSHRAWRGCCLFSVLTSSGWVTQSLERMLFVLGSHQFGVGHTESGEDVVCSRLSPVQGGSHRVWRGCCLFSVLTSSGWVTQSLERMLFVHGSHQFGVGHTESGEDVVCSRLSPVRGGSHRAWRGCCLFSVLTSSGWVTQSLERMLFVLGSHQFGVGHTESGEDVVCSRLSPVRCGSHRVWRGCCLFSVLTSSGWVTQSLERMLFVHGSHQFGVGHTESGEDVVCSRLSPVRGGSHRAWRGCCLFSVLTSSGWVTQSLERMLFVLGSHQFGVGHTESGEDVVCSGSHQFRVGHTESGEDVVCSRFSPVRGGSHRVWRGCCLFSVLTSSGWVTQSLERMLFVLGSHQFGVGHTEPGEDVVCSRFSPVRGGSHRAWRGCCLFSVLTSSGWVTQSLERMLFVLGSHQFRVGHTESGEDVVCSQFSPVRGGSHRVWRGCCLFSVLTSPGWVTQSLERMLFVLGSHQFGVGHTESGEDVVCSRLSPVQGGSHRVWRGCCLFSVLTSSGVGHTESGEDVVCSRLSPVRGGSHRVWRGCCLFSALTSSGWVTQSLERMLFVLGSHQFGVGHTEPGEDVVCSRFSPVSGWVTQSLERMLFVLGSHQFRVGHTESGEDVVCSQFSPVRGGSHRVWRGCCLFSVLTSPGWVTQSLERMLFVLGSHQSRVGHTESGEDVVCSRLSPVRGGSHRVWRGCCLFSALTSSGWVTQSLERMLFVLGFSPVRGGSHRAWRGCCLFSVLTSSGWVTQSLERMLFVHGSHQFGVGHTESGEDVVCSRFSPVQGGSHRVWRRCCLFSVLTSPGWVTQSLERMLFVLSSHQFGVGHTESGEDVVCSRFSPVQGGSHRVWRGCCLFSVLTSSGWVTQSLERMLFVLGSHQFGVGHTESGEDVVCSRLSPVRGGSHRVWRGCCLFSALTSSGWVTQSLERMLFVLGSHQFGVGHTESGEDVVCSRLSPVRGGSHRVWRGCCLFSALTSSGWVTQSLERMFPPAPTPRPTQRFSWSFSITSRTWSASSSQLGYTYLTARGDVLLLHSQYK